MCVYVLYFEVKIKKLEVGIVHSIAFMVKAAPYRTSIH